MEKMKKIAEKIAKAGELSEKEKVKSIQSLYKKMGTEKKPNSVYIVRKKFHGGKGPGAGKHSKVKIVDPRMKSTLSPPPPKTQFNQSLFFNAEDKLGKARADIRQKGKKPPKQTGARRKHSR